MSFLDLAKDAVKRGFFVFPLAPNTKSPLKGSHGYKDATQDLQQIESWHKENPDYNIGFSTDKFLPPGEKEPCALIVVDIDERDGKHGYRTIIGLELEGYDFKSTLEQATASGGAHLIYRFRRAVRRGSGVLGRGVDVCSSGSYIVGAGSKIQGKTYSFRDPSLRPQEAPHWLVERLGAPRDKEKVPPELKRAIRYLKDEAPKSIEFQGANATSLQVAMNLRDRGIPRQKALELMLEHYNEQKVSRPWDLVKLSTIVSNAYKYAKESFGNKAPEVEFDETLPPEGEGEEKKLDPISEMNKEYAFVLNGSSHYIIWEKKDVDGRPLTQHLKEDTFHRLNAAKTMQFGDKSKPVTKLWMTDKCRRTYQGFCFKPEKTVSPEWYNLWRGFTVKPSEEKGETHESVQAFLEHAEKNICQGDKELTRWLLGYFAHLIQKPWEKPLTALVFKGKKGVGKSALMGRVGYLLGNHSTVAADSRYLTGNFNSHLENCLCIVLEEAFWSGDPKSNGILKHLVTGEKHKIERKGHEAYDIDNLTRVAIIGNEDWLVPASEDERRYAVFNVGEGRKQDVDFFENMRVGMENGGYAYLLRYLLDFDLTGLNFRVPPKTKGLLEQKIASLNPLQEWWFKSLHQGSIDGGEWGKEVGCDDVRQHLYHHLQSRNIRSRYPDERLVGKKIRDFCTSMERKQIMEDKSRKWFYALPSLEVAREEWEKFIGHKVDWDDG